ncbi:MAG: MFS transporter [Candidatus Rokubacteria bacterium]|nr:MFS transporter [Candidatus Rokubacteria bacterium]
MNTGRWGILVLLLTVQTFANVGPMGLPAIAPLIRQDLGLSLTQAGSFLSAYYVGPILMSLPAGWLADRWGILRTMVVGETLIALGLAAAGGAGSFSVLIVLMILAGTGYGLLNPTSTKAVIAWFPPAQRATAVGLKQTGLPFGGAVGAAVLPLIALLAGWRSAVILSAGGVVVLGVATLFLYRDPADLPRATPGSPAPSMWSVLRSRDLWMVASATLIFAAMQTVWMSFLVLYLQDVVRLPVVTAARYLAQAQAMGVVGRVAFGLLSDRTFGGRRRIVLFLAGIGSGLCSLVMAGIGPGSSPWLLSALALAFGFVGIGWNGVQHTLMAELAGARAAGTAVGLGLAVSSLGVTLGPPAFGWLVERIGGYRVPWIALAASMVVALALLGFVREGRRRYDG